MTLEDSVNEVFRKIGRNIMLFQQLESLLKYLVINSNISGYASDINELRVRRAASIGKQTMGTLIGQYVEISNPNYEENESDPNEITEPFISFSFRIGCDSVYYETRKEELARMVAERNELVHHLLPCFDRTSAESCENLGKKLDRQSDNIKKEIAELESKATRLHKGSKKMADFLVSEEVKRQIELSFLRQSRLVILLGDIAIQTKRSDGWALLTVADHLVKQHAPEEIALLKERYGHKSLKKLMLATEIFDFFDENTKKGGFRVLYRLKPGWELSNA